MIEDSIFHEKDITLLLILKERHDFTKRWLEYFQYSKCTCQVLIADGSAKPLSSELLESFHGSFEYLYSGEDISIRKYLEKMVFALNKIKTKYVMLAANDDFIMFNSLQQLHQKLEHSPDLASAMGLVLDLGLETTDKEKVNKISYIHAHQMQVSLLEDEVSQRLLQQIRYPSAGWHALVRTDILVKVYNILLRRDFRNFELTIYLADLLVSCFGKTELLPNTLMMMHEIHGDQEAYRLTPFSDRKNDPQWRREFSSAIELVLETCEVEKGVVIDSHNLINEYESWEEERLSRSKKGVLSSVYQIIKSKLQYEIEQRIKSYAKKPASFPQQMDIEIEIVRKFLLSRF